MQQSDWSECYNHGTSVELSFAVNLSYCMIAQTGSCFPLTQNAAKEPKPSQGTRLCCASELIIFETETQPTIYWIYFGLN